MDNRKRFPPEVRERAVRLVFDQANEYSSQWACIAALAPKFGCTAQRPLEVGLSAPKLTRAGLTACRRLSANA